jgi:hypothetical protein|tara:strand:- start:1755 stop:2246 length:492 start_codon:yes stop_codon:yes gene_type:complete
MNGFKVKDTVMLTDVNRYPDGIEVPSNYLSGKVTNGKLWWRPVNLVKPDYDPEIETRTFSSRTVNDASVDVTYVVTDRDLAEVKTNKLEAARVIGRAKLHVTYDQEEQTNAAIGESTAEEKTTIRAAIASYKTYFQTDLKPAVNACTTVQQVKAIVIDFPDIP